jgi:hypothetical protein
LQKIITLINSMSDDKNNYTSSLIYFRNNFRIKILK